MNIVCYSVLFDSWYVLGGKRDERLILPTNGSVSVTLDLQQVWLKDIFMVTFIYISHIQ